MAEVGLSRDQVAAYIDGFSSCRICVIGDVMLDRYFWGVVDRISPEAPVPVVRVNRRSSRLGGAANVGANLAALGAEVTLVGSIGDDRAGGDVRELLARRGIVSDHLHVRNHSETTEKVRIIAQSQQVVRADFESEPTNEDEASERAFSKLADWAEGYDALVVSDYGKGVIRERFLRELIAGWRSRHKPVLVDPHIAHFRWYAGASIVTPNTKEAASFFGAPTLKGEDLFETLGYRMLEELRLEGLLITRGEEGMSLFLEGRKQIHIPTVAKEVYDVTGAGDTVISVLGATLACRVPLVEAVTIANQAAGHVVKEVGTSTITSDKLLNLFE